MARTRPVDPTTDLGLLSLVVATGVTERISERLADTGFDDVRDSHGYVVQGLLAGDTTVTQLGARLGISAQAVSKTVRELERAGYVAARHRCHRPPVAPAPPHRPRRAAGGCVATGPARGRSRPRTVARHP